MCLQHAHQCHVIITKQQVPHATVTYKTRSFALALAQELLTHFLRFKLETNQSVQQQEHMQWMHVPMHKQTETCSTP